MKKTILVIEGADLVRKYLLKKLGEYGFEVLEAKTGFEGLIRLKNDRPDLVVMEYLLPKVSGVQILEEKFKYKAIADIPVIMFTSKVDRDKIVSVAKYKLARFFSKPLRVDVLMKAVSEILGREIALDATPCAIDVHLNEQILFIEVAQGLNRETVELMGYKIREILRLYDVKTPRVLVIMTGIDLSKGDAEKLAGLFRTILDMTGAPLQAIKLLTTSEYVKKFVSSSDKLSDIEIVPDLTKAMDLLLGIKVSDFIQEGYRIVRDDMLSSKGELEEAISMNFESDKGISIAVVDDDIVTRELVAVAMKSSGAAVLPFENGKLFVSALANTKFDLVFLDLLMPVMDGFAVLAHTKTAKADMPIIILSALSEKETVVKAMSFGIKSYLAKPLTPVDIQKKAAEILKLNF